MPSMWSKRDVMGVALLAVSAAALGFWATGQVMDGATSPVSSIVETELFGAGPKQTSVARSGWYPAEEWGAWSSGSVAVVEWPLAGRPSADVLMQIAGRIFPYFADLPQSIRVLVNETPVAVLTRNYEGQLYGANFRIPAQVATARTPMKIEFRIANPTAPSAVIKSNDHRKIGLGIESIQLRYDVDSRSPNGGR